MSNAAEIAGRPPAYEAGAAAATRGARTLVRSGSLTIVDQLVASGTTFATGMLIGRACSKAEFGLYMLGFSVVTFLMTIQGSLISTPYQIYYPRTDEPLRPRLTGSALFYQLVLASLAAAVLGLLSLGAWIMQPVSGMTALLCSLGVAVLFLLLRDFIRQVCFAQFQILHALAFDTAVAILQLASLGLLALSGVLSAANALLALGLTCALGSLGWLWACHDGIALDRSSARADLSLAWSSGKWLFASGLAWSVSMNLYAWIIAGFHGAASVGAWGVAVGTVTLLNPLILGLQNYVGPRIMHAYKEDSLRPLARAVAGSSAIYSGILTAFGVAMFVFGDVLVTLLYGAKYAGCGAIVAVLSVNLIFVAAGFCVSRGLFAMERASLDFRVNVIALVAMIVAGVALAKTYGPLGAAWGQAATSAIAALVRTGVFVSAIRRASETSV